MSTYTIKATYWHNGLPNCSKLKVKAVTPEQACAIVLNSINKLFRNAIDPRAEVLTN